MAETKKRKSADKKSNTQSIRRSKYITLLQGMQEDSQEYLILKHILEHGSITPKEAEKKPIYSMRLGARIWDLKHMHNVPIKTETVSKKRGKKVVTYARYYIGE